MTKHPVLSSSRQLCNVALAELKGNAIPSVVIFNALNLAQGKDNKMLPLGVADLMRFAKNQEQLRRYTSEVLEALRRPNDEGKALLQKYINLLWVEKEKPHMAPQKSIKGIVKNRPAF